jgi:hypothetical protein
MNWTDISLFVSVLLLVAGAIAVLARAGPA